MKLKKIYFGLIAAVAGFAFASCSSDDNYSWASQESGAQVYFSSELPSTITVSKSESSFNITVNRVDSSAQLSVPLNVTKNTSTIYTIPSAVEFAAGSKTANLTITYNPDDVEYGVYDTITVQLGSNTTVYGISDYTFNVGATEWVSYGTAQYREDCMTTFFDVDNIVYEVPIERNIVTDGVYRLVYPYGSLYGYNDVGDYDTSKDYYMTIHAEDPDMVWIEGGETGMNWSYGMISIISYVQYYLQNGNSLDDIKVNAPQYFGKLENGVVTMPEQSMLIGMADYNDGGMYYANSNGLFAIAFPNYVIADYSLAWSRTGTYVGIGGDEYITGTFTMGEDITSVKCALTADAAAVDSIAAGIEDGSVDGIEYNGSGEVQLPVDGSGTYYLVYVGYNSNDEAVATMAESIKFVSTKEDAETWTAKYTGVYTYTTDDFSENQSGGIYSGSHESVLYQSDSDPNRYKIAPWAEENSEGLIFTMDDSGYLTVSYCTTGYEHPTYGTIYASDLVTLQLANAPSVYDSSTGTYYFELSYHIVQDGEYAGYFAVCEDQFTITGTAGAKAVAPIKHATADINGKKLFPMERNPKMMKDKALIKKADLK